MVPPTLGACVRGLGLGPRSRWLQTGAPGLGGLCLLVASWRASSKPAARGRADLPLWEGASKPVEAAHTLPSAWYHDPSIAAKEATRVFGSSWQVVGHTGEVREPGQFFTGKLLRNRFVVVRGEDNELRAFDNVCRHHAAAVAEGSGCAHEFKCMYHGWTYDLQGRLRKATRLKGIQDFKASENGLHPIPVSTWGPLVMIWAGEKNLSSPPLDRWVGEKGFREVSETGILDQGLAHVARKVYDIPCNWKVFVDNYLDGGYHVPFAHEDLAGGLDLDGYTSEVLGRVSVQRCAPGGGSGERLGGGRPAAYSFVFPNLMLNRYGPWLDTNVVTPTGQSSCRVRFDYWVEGSRAGDAGFVEESIAASHQVQLEDHALCESVQGGLESGAYDAGRYAGVEAPMHAFHQVYYRDMTRA